MPSRQEHLDKWRHNEGLSRQLDLGPYQDWSVTTMFYAALHLVEAYFASQTPPVQTHSHVSRNKIVQSDANLAPVWQDYLELYDRSRDARYDCLPFSAAVVSAIRQQTFEPFKRHLRGILGV